MTIAKHLIATWVLLCLNSRALASSKIPKVSLDQLKNGNLDQAQTQYGDTIEAMIVTGLSEDYQLALDRLIADAPDCLVGSHKHHKHMQHLPKIQTPDGSVRTTYATEEAEFPTCLNMMGPLTDAFDEVEEAIVNLIQKAHGGDKKLGYVTSEGSGVTLLQDAPVKDHVHVYKKEQKATNGEDLMVPYHTDNGLFLILTPFPDTGLIIKMGDGSEVQTANEVGPQSVLVLIGRGTTEWLLQEGGYPKSKADFQASEHAVPALSGSVTQRSVYARMKVAPGGAIPASGEGSKAKGLRTFNEVFMETVAHPKDNGLCLMNHERPLNLIGDTSDNSTRTWLRALEDQCKEGEAQCWMGCYPVPVKCQGHPEEMKCYDDKKNEECTINGGDGKPMGPDCKWHCFPASSTTTTSTPSSTAVTKSHVSSSARFTVVQTPVSILLTALLAVVSVY